MSGETPNNPWPLPKFRFEVDLGTDLKSTTFSEVTGLETETQVLAYRFGSSPVPTPVKMPGMARFGNVTLRHGTFVNNDAFRSWYQQIALNKIKRTTVVIRLLDEEGNTAMSWTLTNAWPVKVQGVDTAADGNEIAVEMMEIAHEGIAVH